MLCAFCQAFDFRFMATEVIATYRDPLPSPDYDNSGSYLFKYHATILDVQSAVAQGCELCALLWDTWLENSPNWVWYDFWDDDEENDQVKKEEAFKFAISDTPESFKPNLSFKLNKLWLDKDARFETGRAQINREEKEIEYRLFRQALIGINFELKGNSQSLIPDEGVVTLGIYAEAEDDAVSEGLFTLRQRSSAPDFDIANKWLQQCLSNDFCGSSNAIPQLPTRVIAIGQSTSDIRLIESSGQHAKYTALSHCWGTSPIWTTTVKNQRLPHCSQLPGNFQDAITVTRMLGLQYLWIDSLCILQDSAEDWEIECANMANIYRNAEVTISVRDNTSSSLGGFLQDAGCKPYKMCQLNDGLVISNQKIDSPSRDSPIPFGAVDGRGWILQEKLLSRRLLHFSKQMMYWQCCRHTYFESRHHPIPAGVMAASRAEYVKKLPLDNLGSRGAKSVYTYWYEVVRDYSGRQLTKPIDRLPALSGVASLMGSVLKDTYLAGLWKNDFVWGLCWSSTRPWYYHPGQEAEQMVNGANRPFRAKEWIAPSWSWTSCNRCVSWENRLGPSTTKFYEERLKVQQVYTRSKGHDFYGVISSASLTVVGKMKTALVEPASCFDPTSGKSLGAVFFDDKITDVSQLENTAIVEKNSKEKGFIRSAEVFLLLVVTTGTDLGIEEPAGISRFYFNDFCLILTRGNESNTYCRVGSLRTPTYVISPGRGPNGQEKEKEMWSKDNAVRYPWFDDSKEQDIVIQ